LIYALDLSNKLSFFGNYYRELEMIEGSLRRAALGLLSSRSVRLMRMGVR